MSASNTPAGPTASESGSRPFAELFHLVESLVPEGQTVIKARPNMTVAEAIEIMAQRNFSQLPIIAGHTVLGVFSFRSLAQGILKLGSAAERVGELPVTRFIEEPVYAQPSDNWESILGHLDSHDVVLVGPRERLQAIVTPMDVLNYLHAVASPFVLLAEIELSLRSIIQDCVSREQLEQCMHISLSGRYGADTLPADLSEMTFNDYVQIIAHSQSWPYFERALGKGEPQRKHMTQQLTRVRDLRNHIFHFRGSVSESDRELLTETSNLLRRSAITLEAERAEKAAPAKREEKAAAPTRIRAVRRWDEPSFLQDLETRRSAEESAVAQRVMEWARAKGLVLRWGRGKVTGSCSPALLNKPAHSIFALWSDGSVGLCLGYLKKIPPYMDERKRAEWLQRLNAVPGVALDESETDGFPGFPLSALTGEGALERFLDTADWVLQEIDRAEHGPEEPTPDDFAGVLTRRAVPRGQQQLYKALYDAGDPGLTHAELVEVMGRRDRRDLAGLLGALGHRINGVPGYGQARQPGIDMVIAREQLPDGQQRLRLVPGMREALEALDPPWLHEMTP